MKIIFNYLRILPKVTYRLCIPTKLARRYNLFKYEKLYRKTLPLRENKNNGVYYFLGNFHQHMSHVMPLYRFIGGTVVVLSESSKKEVEKYDDVKCIYIDNDKEIWLNLDKKIKKTVNFLNEEAKVIVFYDTFYYNNINIKVPTLHLGHGNGVKGALMWDVNRYKELNKLTKIASIGSYNEQYISKYIAKEKIVPITNTRTDAILQRIYQKNTKAKLLKSLGFVKTKNPIIAYMPTYWGPSSVNDTGINIVKNIPDNYNLVFWPHPQTPEEIIGTYKKIIKNRNNVIYPQQNKNISLEDIYAVADCFISDHTTSVILDILITQKPLIFAFGAGNNRDDTVEKSPLKYLVNHSVSIHGNDQNIEDKIKKAVSKRQLLKIGIITKIKLKDFNWQPNGGATAKTINIIKEMIADGK